MPAREPFLMIPLSLVRSMEDGTTTPSEVAVYLSVRRFCWEHKAPCTASVRSIGRQVHRGQRQTRDYLDSLHAKGYLAVQDDESLRTGRAFVIPGEGESEDGGRQFPAGGPIQKRPKKGNAPRRNETVTAADSRRLSRRKSADELQRGTESPPSGSPSAEAPGSPPGAGSGHPPVSAAPPSTPEPPPLPAVRDPSDVSRVPTVVHRDDKGCPLKPDRPPGELTPAEARAYEKVFNTFRFALDAWKREQAEARKAERLRSAPTEEELQQRMVRQLTGALAEQNRQSQASGPQEAI